jgi:ADP-ribose pyrophosphatase YjhB (NUDIX family)
MSDPAAGKFEFPGGHCNNGEGPRQAAIREWQEETGLGFPDGEFGGTWTSADGIYQGFVYTIAREADLDIFSRHPGTNPDDPDGDAVETLAWMDPADLPGNPAVRAELLASIDAVMAALGWTPELDDVAKAAGTLPKAPAPSGSARDWHGWTLDRKTAVHWAPKVRDSVTAALPREKARDMGRDYLAAHPHQDGKADGKRDRNKAAAGWVAAWVATQGITLIPVSIGQGVAVDGYAIGAMSAEHQVTGAQPDTQSPGDEDSARKRVEEAGLAAVLAALLHGGDGSTPAAEAVAEAIAAGYARSLAIILAGTDADWAGSQETLDELGGILSAALADEETAVTLVGTEINIYTGLAANDYYMANSVAWGCWINAGDTRVCPVCLKNAAQGPVLMGQPYQSGHTMPPAHPGGCIGRCAVIPSPPPGA